VSDTAARKAAFAALLSVYHNSFTESVKGVFRHSLEFIRRALSEGKKEALGADPRMTSTSEGAVAIAIAKQIMRNERAARNFIDIELAEGAFVVSFEKELKADEAVAIVSTMGKTGVLARPKDKIGEGIVSDILILAVEPTQQVAEAFLKEARSAVDEGKRADAYAKAQADAVKGLHAKFQKEHGRDATAAEVHQHVLSKRRSPEEMAAFRKHLGENAVTEAEGRFKAYGPDAAFVTKDGQHKWVAGKNLDYGTHDHRHYVKNGESWKHVEAHGYDGHESKADAIAAAKGDAAQHDAIIAKGGKIGESVVQALYTHAYGADAWAALDESSRADRALQHMMKSFSLPGIPGAKTETGNAGFDAAMKAACATAKRGKMNETENFDDLVDDIAVAIHENFAGDFAKVVAATVRKTAVPAKDAAIVESTLTDDAKAGLLQAAARNLLLSVGIVPAALSEALAKWTEFATIPTSPADGGAETTSA
jgi:hypothetical protein